MPDSKPHICKVAGRWYVLPDGRFDSRCTSEPRFAAESRPTFGEVRRLAKSADWQPLEERTVGNWAIRRCKMAS